MKVDAGAVQTYETDDRGRISLGTEYANKRVTVAIVDVENLYPGEDELAAAYRDASENATSLAEEWLEDLLGTMAQRYTIEVTKEHGEWFAEDVDLGVSGNGETRAEAVSQLAEAIAYETGELEFSDEFRSELETAPQQIETGQTHSAADVRDRLGIDD